MMPIPHIIASLRIQDLSVDDRPREKLLKRGVTALTDAELLAVLIGSGTRDMSVVTLAQHILKSNGNRLQELAKRSVQELLNFRGIGEAKAITIVCAMELTRRRACESTHKKELIDDPLKAYALLHADLADKLVEEFWVLLLNRGNYLIKKIQISSGGTTSTIADPRMIFRLALAHQAVSIILAHNHPSGVTSPSANDVKLTNRLVAAGKLLDIFVIDHIICTEKNYFSFADQGMINQ